MQQEGIGPSSAFDLPLDIFDCLAREYKLKVFEVALMERFLNQLVNYWNLWMTAEDGWSLSSVATEYLKTETERKKTASLVKAEFNVKMRKVLRRIGKKLQYLDRKHSCYCCSVHFRRSEMKLLADEYDETSKAFFEYPSTKR